MMNHVCVLKKQVVQGVLGPLQVIFVFNIEHLEPFHKLILFILAERALMALKWTIENFLGAKTVAQLQAEEHNEKVLDKVLSPLPEESIDPVFFGCGTMH